MNDIPTTYFINVRYSNAQLSATLKTKLDVLEYVFTNVLKSDISCIEQINFNNEEIFIYATTDLKHYIDKLNNFDGFDFVLNEQPNNFIHSIVVGEIGGC